MKRSYESYPRKQIEFEDDFVIVYEIDEIIYKGIEDYDPMKDVDWKWDNTNKIYTYGNFIKICVDA